MSKHKWIMIILAINIIALFLSTAWWALLVGVGSEVVRWWACWAFWGSVGVVVSIAAGITAYVED